MTNWQRVEMARFDADKADRPGDDMRVGEAIWPAPTCVHCDAVIEAGVECDECAEEDED
jgi:hypothetical protein